ncbi:MAG TPA: hypothetical protein VFZ84_04425 [Burkholderiales bacterium]
MDRKFLVSVVAAAFLGGAGAASAQSSGATAPTNYGESMVRLQQAAQKLREAVQAMAQQPAGERRNAAADEAREAIVETQRAMIDLPPELRMGAGTEPNYTKSMERLQEAAQRLRDAVQAMAKQPAGPRRNEAMQQANQALFDTQQAMVQLPPDLRTSQKR